MPTANELSPRRGPSTDKEFVRLYERTFEVIFADNEAVGGVLANIATGVSLFSPHPEDFQALCINFDPQQSPDDDRYWTVGLQYSSAVEVGDDGQPQTQQNPLERKARVRYAGRKYTEAVTRDINGTLIRNYANDPYDHSEEKTRTAIQIQRNLPWGTSFGQTQPFEGLFIEEYTGAINSTNFLGRFPKEVLLDDLDAELKQEQGVIFWEVNAVFVISRIKIIDGVESGGWITRKLNAGYRRLTAAGKWVEIRDEFGQRPSRPVLLDGNGAVLNPGTPAAPATPIYRHFYTKPEKDFSELGLLT